MVLLDISALATNPWLFARMPAFPVRADLLARLRRQGLAVAAAIDPSGGVIVVGNRNLDAPGQNQWMLRVRYKSPTTPPPDRPAFGWGVTVILALLTAGFATGTGMLPAMPQTLPGLILATGRELLLGGLLGFGILTAFGALALGGRLLDYQMGFGIATLFDPATRGPRPGSRRSPAGRGSVTVPIRLNDRVSAPLLGSSSANAPRPIASRR